MRSALVTLLLVAVAATAAALWFARGSVMERAEFTLPAPRLTHPQPSPAAVSNGPLETSLQVIVNSSTPAPPLTRALIEDIYLGRRRKWDDGTAIIPVMPRERGEASREFLAVFLHKTPEQFRGYWRKEILAGAVIVPVTIDVQEELVEYVARNPGAIGLVNQVPDDQRIIVAPVAEVTLRPRVAPSTETTETTDTTETTGTTQPTGQISEPAVPETTGSASDGEEFNGPPRRGPEGRSRSGLPA